MIKKTNKFFILSVITTVLSGCASITQGLSQPIAFEIEPTSATCSLVNDDGNFLGRVTPISSVIHLSKSSDDLILHCVAEGYKSSNTKIVSTTQPLGVASLLLDFGITDMITGAMWAYPSVVAVTLLPIDAPVHRASLK